MSLTEEVIDATLESDGSLRLSHPPQLAPGPVRVTIQAAPVRPARRLADVIRQIAADQRARGYPGRSEDDLRLLEELQVAEAEAYEREIEAARGSTGQGGP